MTTDGSENQKAPAAGSVGTATEEEHQGHLGAGVDRLCGHPPGTFYLHYRDIYDLYAQIEAETAQEVKGILERTTRRRWGTPSHDFDFD